MRVQTCTCVQDKGSTHVFKKGVAGVAVRLRLVYLCVCLFVCLLVGWLVGWLVGCVVCSFVGLFVCLSVWFCLSDCSFGRSSIFLRVGMLARYVFTFTFFVSTCLRKCGSRIHLYRFCQCVCFLFYLMGVVFPTMLA